MANPFSGPAIGSTFWKVEVDSTFHNPTGTADNGAAFAASKAAYDAAYAEKALAAKTAMAAKEDAKKASIEAMQAAALRINAAMDAIRDDGWPIIHERILPRHILGKGPRIDNKKLAEIARNIVGFVGELNNEALEDKVAEKFGI